MTSIFHHCRHIGAYVLFAATLGLAGCGGSAATTRPVATGNADVLAAHGYAVPRDQLARFVSEALDECGWTLTSTDDAGGAFVAQKHLLFQRAYTMTIVMRPVGDRLRVDVTSTSDQPQVFERGDNKKNVWTFYEALDKRAGDPGP